MRTAGSSLAWKTGRTAVLYLGWSAAYLLIVQLPDWVRTGWWGLHTIKDYLVAFVFQGSYYHLWYLLAMLYAVPVLYGILSVLSVRKAAVVAAVLWVCECLTYSYTWIGIDRIATVMLIGTKMPVVYDTLFRAVPLLFSGAFLSQSPPIGKKRGLAVLLGFLLCACEATLLFILQPQSGRYSYLFATPLSTHFVMKYLLSCRPVRLSPDTGTRMRSLSTTVYLVHPMVIAFMSPLSLPEGPVHYCAVLTLSFLVSVLYEAVHTGVRCFIIRLRENRSLLPGK